MRILLEMGFRGNRSYLQGTSFFDALEQVSPEFTGEHSCFVTQLVFRHLARHLCELSSCPPNAKELLAGQGRYRVPGGEDKNFWLIETSKPAIGRQPYNEDALFANAIILHEERSIHLIKQSGTTPIEDVVGLTKILNYKLMPNVSGKWLFGQIDLISSLREDYRRVDIRMQNAFAERFSVNEILLDEAFIGTIRFIVGEA